MKAGQRDDRVTNTANPKDQNVSLGHPGARRASGPYLTGPTRNRSWTLPAQPRSPRARFLSPSAIHCRTGVVKPVFDRLQIAAGIRSEQVARSRLFGGAFEAMAGPKLSIN